MNSFCLISLYLFIMHWQQQECQSYSYFLRRLHTYTQANHLHDNMYTHIHTSLILLFPHGYQLSSLPLQSHFPPYLDDFVSVLKWVQYIEYFIIFSSFMYYVMFAYMLSLSFLGICSLVLFLSVICHVFHFFFCIFWWNLGYIIHMKCININDSSLWYTLSMYFIVQISFSFMRFFKCFSLPFPSFMTMLIGTQSHGSEKQWWHNSVSMHGYILTSTKRSFFGNFV